MLEENTTASLYLPSLRADSSIAFLYSKGNSNCFHSLVFSIDGILARAKSYWNLGNYIHQGNLPHRQLRIRRHIYHLYPFLPLKDLL